MMAEKVARYTRNARGVLAERPGGVGVGTKQNGLFRPGRDFNLNACVGINGGPADFHRQAWGCFEAGERLV